MGRSYGTNKGWDGQLYRAARHALSFGIGMERGRIDKTAMTMHASACLLLFNLILINANDEEPRGRNEKSE